LKNSKFYQNAKPTKPIQKLHSKPKNKKPKGKLTTLKLDWDKVKERYKKDPATYTKDGTKFQIGRITDTTIFLDLPCGERPIRRINLEKAVQLLTKGEKIIEPEDYIKLVKNERSANAWAILRDMGFIK
jgi:hypothetical protein